MGLQLGPTLAAVVFAAGLATGHHQVGTTAAVVFLLLHTLLAGRRG